MEACSLTRETVLPSLIGVWDGRRTLRGSSAFLCGGLDGEKRWRFLQRGEFRPVKGFALRREYSVAADIRGQPGESAKRSGKEQQASHPLASQQPATKPASHQNVVKQGRSQVQKFENAANLASFLETLRPGYETFADRLFENGFVDIDEVLSADKDDLMSAGVPSLQASNIVRLFASGLVPACDSMRLFWAGLPEAKIDAKGGAMVLRLKEGTHFLGHVSCGSALMIRDCYGRLQDRLEAHFAEGGVAAAVIGNPGIGKTFLAYYLLRNWRLKGFRVVVVNQGICKPTLLCDEGAYTLKAGGLEKELTNPNTRFILDTVNPMDIGWPDGAKMVLVTSPKRSRYRQAFKMAGYVFFYMDTWSKSEITLCRELVYPKVPVTDVQKRYSMWGGIPRYIFDKSADRQDLLLRAIASCTTRVIRKNVGEQVPHPSVSRVLHLRVADDFQTIWVEFASPFVAERVFSKLFSEERAKLETLLSSAAGLSELAGARWTLWKLYAHKRLETAGTSEFGI